MNNKLRLLHKTEVTDSQKQHLHKDKKKARHVLKQLIISPSLSPILEIDAVTRITKEILVDD